ncbi:MAG: hypothetical protein ACOX2S_02695 [bacterium]
MDYVVLRHGGRNRDAWREVYRGPQEKAEAKYANLFKSHATGWYKVSY